MSSTSTNNNDNDECPTTPVKPREDQAFATSGKTLKRDEPAVAGKVLKRRRRKRSNGEVIATKPKSKKPVKPTSGIRIVNHRDIVLETDPLKFRTLYDIEVFDKDGCNRFTSLSEDNMHAYGVTDTQLNAYKRRYKIADDE